MCCPASWAALGAAVIGGVASHVQANQQAADARGAAADATKAAGTPQAASAPNTPQLTTGTPGAVGVNSGPASTLLTGAGGISNSSLNLGALSGLGNNNLLGQ